MDSDSNRPYAMVSYHDSDRRLNVSVVSDRVLFLEEYGVGRLMLLSVLGPHSAVRGVLAAASVGCELRCDAYPQKRFYGTYNGGGRMVTHALSKDVTHGAYLAPEVVVSSEPGRIVVLDETPKRVLDRLNHLFAIPVLPSWADWLFDTLKREKMLVPLTGKGASGCLITTSEETLDGLIAKGVREQQIRF